VVASSKSTTSIHLARNSKSLPDVGETTARRIVDYRKRNGPFQSLDDLRQVRGIGPKTMERLRPYFLPIEPQVAEK
jgi:competence ComEA-like helix-hairpin-helix protein